MIQHNVQVSNMNLHDHFVISHIDNMFKAYIWFPYDV